MKIDNRGRDNRQNPIPHFLILVDVFIIILHIVLFAGPLLILVCRQNLQSAHLKQLPLQQKTHSKYLNQLHPQWIQLQATLLTHWKKLVNIVVLEAQKMIVHQILMVEFMMILIPLMDLDNLCQHSHQREVAGRVAVPHPQGQIQVIVGLEIKNHLRNHL